MADDDAIRQHVIILIREPRTISLSAISALAERAVAALVPR